MNWPLLGVACHSASVASGPDLEAETTGTRLVGEMCPRTAERGGHVRDADITPIGRSPRRHRELGEADAEFEQFFGAFTCDVQVQGLSGGTAHPLLDPGPAPVAPDCRGPRHTCRAVQRGRGLTRGDPWLSDTSSSSTASATPSRWPASGPRPWVTCWSHRPGFVTWDDWRRDVGLPESWLGRTSDCVVDPDGAGPRISIQVVPDRRTVSNRLRLDIHANGGRDIPIETRKKRVDAEARRLCDLGATLLSDLSEEMRRALTTTRSREGPRGQPSSTSTDGPRASIGGSV